MPLPGYNRFDPAALDPEARSRSNVVAGLPEGAVITGTRADTDLVVTEHGVANLRHGDMEQKARALIVVAAPRFRESLERAWVERR